MKRSCAFTVAACRSPRVDLDMIARGTPGFSGADLANLVNEAALPAARKEKKIVEPHDFEEAIDKIVLGTDARLRDDRHDKRGGCLPRGRARDRRLLLGQVPIRCVRSVSCPVDGRSA